jgi:hypothetical protein
MILRVRKRPGMESEDILQTEGIADDAYDSWDSDMVGLTSVGRRLSRELVNMKTSMQVPGAAGTGNELAMMGCWSKIWIWIWIRGPLD